MYEGLIAETISIEGDGGDRLPAYLARPLGGGPFPSVIVLHHRDGWDWASKEIVRRLAAEGFATIMPHLHHREAPGEPAQVAAAVAKAAGGVADARVLGDTLGAKEFIEAQPYATGRIGIIGYCSGGRQAYMVACSTELDATVVCYGGRIVAEADELHEKMPMAAVDMTPDLSSPVLSLSGALDTRPSPDHIARLQEELERHGKEYRIRVYDETGHAFFAVDRDTYNVTAAREGWAEVLAWFEQHLRAST